MKLLAGHGEALAYSREFRRLVAMSAGVHLLLAFVLAVRFHPGVELQPTPVMVDLIASAPAPAARAPTAAPAAKPKPALEKVVVLPKDKPPPAKPKPDPKPAPQAKPVPRPEPAKPEAPAKTPEEILADLRSRVEARAETAALPASAATGGRFDPEMAAYERRVLALLQSNWVGMRAFGSDPSLLARFVVRVDAVGAIVSVDLVRSSGNSYFDDSAERAIRKSAPLPAPPRPVILDVNFNPGGVA